MRGRPRTRARTALRTAAALADGSGALHVQALAVALGCSPRTARRGLADLAAAGLARRAGAGVWFVSGAVVQHQRSESPDDDGQKTTTDKTTRARLGGLERALREVQRQRDDAQARLRQKDDGRAVSGGAILADLRHTVGCATPSCQRCAAIRQRIAARHPQYVPADDVAVALERGALAGRAGSVLLEALHRTGPGAAQARARAVKALSLAIAGDADSARRALEEA